MLLPYHTQKFKGKLNVNNEPKIISTAFFSNLIQDMKKYLKKISTPSVQRIYVDLPFFNFQRIYVHFCMLCYE